MTDKKQPSLGSLILDSHTLIDDSLMVLQALGEKLKIAPTLHDIEEMGACLEFLIGLLDCHFKLEEGYGNLTAIIEEKPRFHNKIQTLFKQHGKLHDDISEQHRQWQTVAPEDKEQIAKLTNALASFILSLAHHEESEEEVFSDTVYQDIGGQGDS